MIRGHSKLAERVSANNADAHLGVLNRNLQELDTLTNLKWKFLKDIEETIEIEKAENAALKAQNATLLSSIHTMKAEEIRLRGELADIEKEIPLVLKKAITSAEERVCALETQAEALEQTISDSIRELDCVDSIVKNKSEELSKKEEKHNALLAETREMNKRLVYAIELVGEETAKAERIKESSDEIIAQARKQAETIMQNVTSMTERNAEMARELNAREEVVSKREKDAAIIKRRLEKHYAVLFPNRKLNI